MLWDEIQSAMKSKAWRSIDAVFADERMQSLFHKNAKLVIEDPISAYSVWGEGDIFRKKAGRVSTSFTEACYSNWRIRKGHAQPGCINSSGR